MALLAPRTSRGSWTSPSAGYAIIHLTFLGGREAYNTDATDDVVNGEFEPL
jgi:hypothetical protein